MGARSCFPTRVGCSSILFMNFAQSGHEHHTRAWPLCSPSHIVCAVLCFANFARPANLHTAMETDQYPNASRPQTGNMWNKCCICHSDTQLLTNSTALNSSAGQKCWRNATCVRTQSYPFDSDKRHKYTPNPVSIVCVCVCMCDVYTCMCGVICSHVYCARRYSVHHTRSYGHKRPDVSTRY